MLSITNVIMDELLGEDRTPRAFRAKFPEEVLQESLAGQLWFGAECLAAGSSIMNREAESAAMRPLAKAVTKSLDIVRNLLREQCLRIKTPNSPTLNLDANDTITETLCESLKIFDRLFAEFELLYVSAMVQVKTKQEHEMQELICVLFSETLQRALKSGHLKQDQVDYFDPALMFSIPRLAIVAGLVVYNKGPLNISMPADHLSEMFRPFRTLLIKIRDLLRTLSPQELFQLEQLLCTNEEIELHTTSTTKNSSGSNYICDDSNKISKSDELVSNVISDSCAKNAVSTVTPAVMVNSVGGGGSGVFDENFFSTASETSPNNTVVDWTATEDDKEQSDNLVSGDCASGYLIPNTNFGNLLQLHEAPLTDRFISSDDEYNSNEISTEYPENGPSHRTNDDQHQRQKHPTDTGDSGICTENTSLDRSPDSDEAKNVVRSDAEPVLASGLREPRSSREAPEATTQIENEALPPHRIRLRRLQERNGLREPTDSSSATAISGEVNSTEWIRRHRCAVFQKHIKNQQHSVSVDRSSNSDDDGQFRAVCEATSSTSESRKASSSREAPENATQPQHQTTITITASTTPPANVGTEFVMQHRTSIRRIVQERNENKWKSKRHSRSSNQKFDDTSGEDTSSSLSEGDPQEVVLALRAAGRMKFKYVPTKKSDYRLAYFTLAFKLGTVCIMFLYRT